MWTILHDTHQCPSWVVLDKSAQTQPPSRSGHPPTQPLAGHMPDQSAKGRPCHSRSLAPVASDAAVVRMTPHLSLVGVHGLSHWLDQLDVFGPIITALQHVIATYQHTHSGDDFTRLHHRASTPKRRLQMLVLRHYWALMPAPLAIPAHAPTHLDGPELSKLHAAPKAGAPRTP